MVHIAEFESMELPMNVIDLFMTYGPLMIQIGLIAAFAFQCWQRNALPATVCGIAMVVTFILGW